MMAGSRQPLPLPRWYTISYSLSFMFRKKQLLGWSILLFLATVTLTAAGDLVGDPSPIVREAAGWASTKIKRRLAIEE